MVIKAEGVDLAALVFHGLGRLVVIDALHLELALLLVGLAPHRHLRTVLDVPHYAPQTRINSALDIIKRKECERESVALATKGTSEGLVEGGGDEHARGVVLEGGDGVGVAAQLP